MLEVNFESRRFQNLKERTPSKMLGVRSSFSFIRWLSEPVSSSPLAIFRILFGLALVLSCIRFLWLGWLEEQYIAPVFHFTYFGFSWVKPFPVPILYGLYSLMTLAAGCIMLGYYYRISATVFFILFNYFELLDKAYYLNHYYFVSLISFLLIVIPMNSRLSLDCYLSPNLFKNELPRWNLILVQFQIACVYFFAGIARARLNDYSGAYRNFMACLNRDLYHFEADRNARRVKKRLAESAGIRRKGIIAGYVIIVCSLFLLLTLWFFYFQAFFRAAKVSETTLTVMTPILLGLVVVGFLLPELNRIKLPGMEAELIQPKDTISSGPKLDIGFGSYSPSISTGPRLT
jgi:hypothetical protein